MNEDHVSDARFRRLAQTPFDMRPSTYSRTPPHFVEITAYAGPDSYRFRNYYYDDHADVYYCYIPPQMTKRDGDLMPVVLPNRNEVVYMCPPQNVIAQIRKNRPSMLYQENIEGTVSMTVVEIEKNDRVARMKMQHLQ